MVSNNFYRHSWRCFDDIRFEHLVSAYGAEGYAVYFHFLDMFYSFSEPLDDLAIDKLARDLKVDSKKVYEILHFADEKCRGLLHQNEAGLWTSTSAEQFLEEKEMRSEVRRHVAEMRWKSGKEPSEEDANAMQKQSNCNPNAKQIDADIDIDIDIDTDKEVGTEVPTDIHTEPAKAVSCPYQSIVDEYNTICGECGLPKCKVITEARKRKMKTIFSEYGMAQISKAFQIVSASPFCRGLTGKTGWRADFDFIFTSSKFPKIIEGAYDSRETDCHSDSRPEDREWMKAAEGEL